MKKKEQERKKKEEKEMRKREIKVNPFGILEIKINH